MQAKIYQPAKTAMQSGKAKTNFWFIDFINEDADNNSVFSNPITGWTGTSDPARQMQLKFPTLEGATKYAQKLGIKYNIIYPKKPKIIIKSYADNFK